MTHYLSLGIFTGALLLIPSLHSPTILFAFGIYLSLYRTTYLNINNSSAFFTGVLLTLFLPFERLQIPFYIYSDFLLSFLFFFIFISLYFHWMRMEKSLSMPVAISSLVGIGLAHYINQINTPWKMLFVAFPGFVTNGQGIYDLFIQREFLSIPMLFLCCSIFLFFILLKFQEKLLMSFSLGSSLASLFYFWPWRSYQNIQLFQEGIIAGTDSAAMPDFMDLRTMLCLIPAIMGIFFANSLRNDNLKKLQEKSS